MKKIRSWMIMKKRFHRAKKWGRMREKLNEERVDERLLEKIDISFALTIVVHVILLRQRWMIGNSNDGLVFCWLTMLGDKGGYLK
ncbi:hypothetical protein Tco_1016765 [Tanacetum coccineum]|uniref:Uncharacterized protein n=1 Tax=Tanacetum coccineum TaxID=301880 RepID=A0ABQ5FPK7_9ASTR